MPTSPRGGSQTVAAASPALAGRLPFDDQADLEAVERGFIGARSPGAITDAGGVVVWDSDSYGFLDGDCPPTANPNLWRQSRLVAKQGLFEVTPGLYQLRGSDLSNMSIIEGDTASSSSTRSSRRRRRPPRSRSTVSTGAIVRSSASSTRTPTSTTSAA